MKKNQIHNQFNFVETKTLPKCSEEQARNFWQEAKEFIACTKFYGSMRWDAECAVAEYIAYKAGFTIRNW